MTRAVARVFLLLCLMLAVAGFGARVVLALSAHDLLDWDETYYASTTSTAAHGLGLYPYIVGYPPIHDMGGVGYVMLLFVIAYKVAGPSLLALRVVSLAASAAAVAGITVLTLRIHGRTAALAAMALTPSLVIFRLSNTIRMDVFAIAFVAWALVLYWHAATRRRTIRSHLLVGFVFALGLEVHLHTAAATFAVGCAYLASWIREPHDARASAKRLVAFVAGYGLGALLFFTVNVLPDTHAFFRTAALARLSAVESAGNLNLTAPMDGERLARTFLSPAVILHKEIERYRTMVGQMPVWERLLWLLGLPAYLLLRRGDGVYSPRLLLVAAVVGGGIVFNSGSPLYWAAILPFFVPAAATLIADGVSPRHHNDTARPVSLTSAALVAVLCAAILPSTVSRSTGALKASRQRSNSEPLMVKMVKEHAAPDCVLAGPSDLYAAYFMEYPRFIGTRRVEVLIGSTYYDLQNNLPEYWREKEPDLIFGPLENGLSEYVAQEKYVRIVESVWRKSDDVSPGCSIRDHPLRPGPFALQPREPMLETRAYPGQRIPEQRHLLAFRK
jgi:4-amino-4-deoxy-L-arabinose transferase-like glycosyltransferase